jgi:hypothetical protein
LDIKENKSKSDSKDVYKIRFPSAMKNLYNWQKENIDIAFNQIYSKLEPVPTEKDLF